MAWLIGGLVGPRRGGLPRRSWSGCWVSTGKTHSDFTVKHFHEHRAKRHGDVLGYTVTKLALHTAGLVRPAPQRSAHRKKRPRRPLRGMLLHQDGSRHQWLDGHPALDPIVTMDDATSEIVSLFVVAEEGTASTFRGLREVVAEHGLFCALYTDRGPLLRHAEGRRQGIKGSEVPAAARGASCSKASRDGLETSARETGASQRPPLTPSARAAEELPCRKGAKGTSKGRALKHKEARERAAEPYGAPGAPASAPGHPSTKKLKVDELQKHDDLRASVATLTLISLG
jgi:hypothetical protein